MADTSLQVYKDDRVVVIKDKYPKVGAIKDTIQVT